MDIIKKNKILKAISDHEPHNITTLAKEIDIPRTTLVRYLIEMNKSGEVEKSRNNVTLVNKFSHEDKAGNKYNENSVIKSAIASEAAKYVEDGDIIFIDGGSTNIHLLKYLSKKDITIYTNNITLVEKVNSDNFKPLIYMVPGELYKPTSTIIGSLVISFINKIHIDKSFIGVNTVNDKELRTTNQEEATIKSTLIDLSAKTYVLYEKSKNNDDGSRYVFGSLANSKVKGVSK